MKAVIANKTLTYVRVFNSLDDAIELILEAFNKETIADLGINNYNDIVSPFLAGGKVEVNNVFIFRL